MTLLDRIRAMFTPKEPEHPGACSSLLRFMDDNGGYLSEGDAWADEETVSEALRRGFIGFEGGGLGAGYLITSRGSAAIKRWSPLFSRPQALTE